MTTRLRPALGLFLSLVVPAGLFVAPASATEEVAKLELRTIDCPNMLPGSMGCQQGIHQFTLMTPNETRAGRTFVVYTKGEIDERLKRLKVSELDPALRALAAEVAELRRSLAEVGAACAETPRATGN
jgi:hypothetical protein